MCGLII